MLIWLASYPRSGNRWSLDILKFCFGWPTTSIYGRQQALSQLGIERDAHAMEHVAERLLLTVEERRQLADSQRIVVLKTHELPEQTYLPGERVLHVVRHPGAVHWSYMHFLRDVDGLSIPLESVIRGDVGFGNWSTHSQQWLAASNALGHSYLRYSYEELHSEIDDVIERIAAWSGHMPIAGSATIPSVEEMRQRYKRGVVRRGRPDEWQEYFTPTQCKLLYKFHGATMQQLGYTVPARYTTRVGNRGEQGLLDKLSSLRSRGKHSVHRTYYRYKTARAVKTSPAILHVTHHRAGSQWVAEVLKWALPNRDSFVTPEAGVRHFTRQPIERGRFYPTLYLPRARVEAVCAESDVPVRRFVVIRDLRDTLISLYFSLRYSHPSMSDGMLSKRDYLANLTVEDGLMSLICDTTLGGSKGNSKGLAMTLRLAGEIQKSWLDAEDVLVVRYEDLVADGQRCFKAILDYTGHPYDARVLRQVVKNNSFEAVTGRPRGQEDPYSHQRKGVAGDWRNYFTQAMKDEFKTRYGETLIAYGYEASDDW